MIKFSIIITVYNTSPYIKKCINSVLNQSYKNYEIIVINDGSTDESEKILLEFGKKIKYYYTKNNGLSVARNIGIKKAFGNYLLFLDSDDFLEPLLLEKINNEIVNKEIDIIRYQIQTVDDNNNIIKYNEQSFTEQSGIEAFKQICNYKYVELATLYAFNIKIFKKNNYLFYPGKYHEDFGLIPLVINDASSVKSIDYIGYNYYTRLNSIMNCKNNYNKAIDVLFHFSNLKLKSNNKYLLSFAANSVIAKAKGLKEKELNNYLSLLKNENISKYLLSNSFTRILKKIIIKINIKMYLKIFV